MNKVKFDLRESSRSQMAFWSESCHGFAGKQESVCIDKRQSEEIGVAKRGNIVKKLKACKNECMQQGVKTLVKMGLLPVRTWSIRALGMASSERLKARRNIEHMMGKQASASLDRQLETQETECQHEVAGTAACFWARVCWQGRWNEDMNRAWRKQVCCEATRWSKS